MSMNIINDNLQTEAIHICKSVCWKQYKTIRIPFIVSSDNFTTLLSLLPLLDSAVFSVEIPSLLSFNTFVSGAVFDDSLSVNDTDGNNLRFKTIFLACAGADVADVLDSVGFSGDLDDVLPLGDDKIASSSGAVEFKNDLVSSSNSSSFFGWNNLSLTLEYFFSLFQILLIHLRSIHRHYHLTILLRLRSHRKHHPL